MKAIYDSEAKNILPWPRIDYAPVIGLESHLLEMTVVQEEEPAYDVATQRLEKTEVIDTDERTIARGWRVVDLPAPTYTPEDWTAQHFTSPQIIALQRFEFGLLQQGKPLGPKMTALKAYLEQMLLASADPTPRTFHAPPCTYAEAAQEAVAALQS